MRNYRWPEREQNKELPNQHKNTGREMTESAQLL